MARTFNGTTQYARHAASPVSAYPITMACWMRTTDATASHRDPFFLGHSSDNSKYYGFQIQPTHEVSLVFNISLIGTTDVNTGAWFHLAAVSSASNNHALFVNGVSEATSAVDVPTFPAVNCVTLGALEYGGTFIQYYPGDVARPMIWNVALTATELLAIADRKVQPRSVRPKNVVFAPPIFGFDSPEPDFSGNRYDLTLTNGPTRANDPPIALWTPRQTMGWLEEAVGNIISSAGQLAFSSFAPVVLLATLLSPGAAQASLSTTAPTVSQNANASAQPAAGQLVLSPTPPSVTQTQHVAITPSSANLVLLGTVPSVTQTAHVQRTPTARDLILLSTAPSVTVSAAGVANPASAQLVFSTTTPSIQHTLHTTIVPARVDLVVSTTAPSVTQIGPVYVTDDFNRANEAPLGPPWIRNPNSERWLKLESNAIRGDDDIGGQRTYVYDFPTAVDVDQFAEVEAQDPGDGHWGPMVRASATANTYYAAVVITDSGGIGGIFKVVNGILTSLSTLPMTPLVAGDVQRLEVEGTTLRQYVNRVLLSSVTDADIATGVPGVRMYQATAYLDNWAGGDLVGVLSSPGSVALVLSATAPSVGQTLHATIVPARADLVLSSTAPTVVQAINVERTPAGTNIVLSATAPTVAQSGNVEQSPTAANLVLSKTAPSVTSGTSASFSPGSWQLVLSAVAPTVQQAQNVTQTPTAANLLLSSTAPTVSQTLSVAREPAAAQLVLSLTAPLVEQLGLDFPFVPAAGQLQLSSAAPTVRVIGPNIVTFPLRIRRIVTWTS